MKYTVFVAVIALLGFTTDAARLSQRILGQSLAEQEEERSFNQFVNKFKRSYRTKGEYGKRLNNFRKNKKFIEEDRNEGDHTYELELNKFADLTNEEFKTVMGLIVPEDVQDEIKAEAIPDGVEEVLSETTADSINWVSKGAVQAVRNQGSCGSCYAFSALGQMESAIYIKSK